MRPNKTQHKTTRVRHETTLDNTSMTQGNTMQYETTRVQHETALVQNSIKFILIYLYYAAY